MTATADEAWPLGEELEALGALSVSLQPLESSAPQLEPVPGTTPLWPELILKALFSSAEAAAVAVSKLRERRFDPQLVPCAERDWIAAGRAGFGPQRFGDRLWIVPDWCAPPEQARSVVHLTPGLAFGTGTHPTTALCLEWLAGAELAGMRVIDYGTGSGILALAAARLGARAVVAVDNDPQALEAVRANAERNGLAIDAVAPDALPLDKADIVIANILARPLVLLAEELLSRLRSGGHLVLAGITTAQADVVAAAYAGRARLVARCPRGDWVRLDLRTP